MCQYRNVTTALHNHLCANMSLSNEIYIMLRLFLNKNRIAGEAFHQNNTLYKSFVDWKYHLELFYCGFMFLERGTWIKFDSPYCLF